MPNINSGFKQIVLYNNNILLFRRKIRIFKKSINFLSAIYYKISIINTITQINKGIMKNVFILLFILFSGTAFSQQQIYYLDKIIEDFENSTNWIAEGANSDDIIRITAAYKLGCPLYLSSKQPEQERVLGIKVEQNEIGEYEIIVRPEEPIYLGKSILELSYWTQGNNNNHYVRMVLLDIDMNPIPDWAWHSSERLNFVGWKEVTYMTTAYIQIKEIYFNGFIIIINPLESITDNYFYFDFINMTYETIDRTTE